MLGYPISRHRRIENFQKNWRLPLTNADTDAIMVHVDTRVRQVAGLIIEMAERGVNGDSYVELEAV